MEEIIKAASKVSGIPIEKITNYRMRHQNIPKVRAIVSYIAHICYGLRVVEISRELGTCRRAVYAQIERVKAFEEPSEDSDLYNRILQNCPHSVGPDWRSRYESLLSWLESKEIPVPEEYGAELARKG